MSEEGLEETITKDKVYPNKLRIDRIVINKIPQHNYFFSFNNKIENKRGDVLKGYKIVINQTNKLPINKEKWDDYKLLKGIFSVKSPHPVEYKIGKKIYHQWNEGGLSVFNTLENAIAFARESIPFYASYQYSKRDIYLCEYKLEQHYLLSDSFVEWQNVYEIMNRIYPKGTLFARWIRLLEIIKSGI